MDSERFGDILSMIMNSMEHNKNCFKEAKDGTEDKAFFQGRYLALSNVYRMLEFEYYKKEE